MAGGGRTPSWRERENNKRRERRRRAITAKIFTGLRVLGNYNLPKHCDNNEVLRALCHEAGWIVEPDGTTYRKGCKPVESLDNMGGSISASPCSSYHPSPYTSFNPSPASSPFTSPASSSHAAHFNIGDGTSLIPWLKQLSSGSSSASTPKRPHLAIHGGSMSAPVTPPMSPTCQTPRFDLKWSPHYPFLPSSTPPSPGRPMVPGPGSLMFGSMSSHPFAFNRDETMTGPSSRVLTPLQSGTCSPAIPSSEEFAFGANTKGLVKAWEGERIQEDCPSDDLELTLGFPETR